MFDAHRHCPCIGKHAIPPQWKAIIATSAPAHWTDPTMASLTSNIKPCFGLLVQDTVELYKTPYGVETEIEKLRGLLTLNKTAGVGEIGVDYRYAKHIPMERQFDVCKLLLSCAQEYGRPAVLHVVGSDGSMVALLKRMQLSIPLLWHGFLGSMETARELFSLGCTISIAPSVWRNGTKLQSRLPSLNIPVLLETDYPFHYRLPGEPLLSYNKVLESHYVRFAQAIGMTVEELEARCDGYASVFTNQ
jgi:Tat protein secretion system quality control protein TatD with DNase activity